ncbi:MAG: tRNA guanosine(34) transglycosylase Tgt [Candidatus Magasanikbacteria bacterium]|nr:tRNA guanosine(34) transglycosylase Tgt [Candidatus Magasanikbacteria bacterium]
MKDFFELIHEDKTTGARAGIMYTDHGDIPTPCFMPVGTQATVKGLDQTDLEKLNAPIILGNTYHLHLRPGEDLISELGGLHKFMNWNRPILTDSGGFQVFSLGSQKEEKGQGGLVDIDEDGVTFRSHLDGSIHRFTPEIAIQIQKKLGADIIMAFDECTPDAAPYDYTKEAMDRTHRWAERCLAEHQRLQTVIPSEAKESLRQNDRRDPSTPPPTGGSGRDDNKKSRQFLFGIIQGANHKDLREESGRYISSLDFDGIAIGGESIGYNMEATGNIMNWLKPILPKDKPRYTMGVGLAPSDLLKVVGMGADMFDCVAPTRLARHGMLFISGDDERININNAPFAKDTGPIDKNCTCEVCTKYTRAYIHHLFAAQEMTGQRLASIHNIHFMLNLMREARQAILEDRFEKMMK